MALALSGARRGRSITGFFNKEPDRAPLLFSMHRSVRCASG